MSSYHSSFSYLDKNSKDDFGWIIASFDPDNGEMDGYFSQEQIYTDSYKGTKRILYGTRYNAVATIKITVIKCGGYDFSVAECRNAYKWLTGKPQASWLDLYVGKELQYSFLGTVQDVKPYKLDARTVGLTIYFESVSPWAYSSIQRHVCSFGQLLDVDGDGVLYNVGNTSSFNIDNIGVLYNSLNELGVTDNGIMNIDNSVSLTINNETDDLYTPVYMNTVFINNNSDHVFISNVTTGEETTISNMRANEIVTLSAEQFIISDVPNKIFGNDFNFVWPRLAPGINNIMVGGSGSGVLEFTYRYPIKINDCVIDTYTGNEDSDCNCPDSGSGSGSNCECTVDNQMLHAMLIETLK